MLNNISPKNGLKKRKNGGENKEMAANLGNRMQNLIIGILSAVIILLVGIALGPTVTEAIADINATTLADVPLGSVIVLLGTYIPTFYYLGIVLAAIFSIWAVVNFKK